MPFELVCGAAPNACMGVRGFLLPLFKIILLLHRFPLALCYLLIR